MEKKYWYAVMIDGDDNDWGCGSFDKSFAETKTAELNQGLDEPTAYIAVIDAGYDEDGNPTTDPLCVDEIRY